MTPTVGGKGKAIPTQGEVDCYRIGTVHRRDEHAIGFMRNARSRRRTLYERDPASPSYRFSHVTENIISPCPWRSSVRKACLSMRGGMARSSTSSLLLLAFTVFALLTLPGQTQDNVAALMHLDQTTTVETGATSNTTSTVVTSSQTSSVVTTTTTTTTSSPVPWDLLIPMLIIGVAAVLTVIVSAVLAVTWRRRRTMSTMQMICPRCRMPVSPYETVCRNCRTPLYQAYRSYPHRR